MLECHAHPARIIKPKNRILIWTTNHQNSQRLVGERLLHSDQGKKGKQKKRHRGALSRRLMSEIISNLYYHNAAIGSTIAASLFLTRDKPPQICILGWAPSPALRQHRPSKAFNGCVLHLNCQSALLIKWISGFRVGGEGGGGGRGRGRGGRKRRKQRRSERQTAFYWLNRTRWEKRTRVRFRRRTVACLSSMFLDSQLLSDWKSLWDTGILLVIGYFTLQAFYFVVVFLVYWGSCCLMLQILPN